MSFSGCGSKPKSELLNKGNETVFSEPSVSSDDEMMSDTETTSSAESTAVSGTESSSTSGTESTSTASSTESLPDVSETESNRTNTDQPVENVHKHSFVGASCTEGGRCECGAVGSALGHNYASATCTAPDTCKRCGATKNSALGHSYSGGKCKRCGDTNGPLKPEEAKLFNNKLTDEENAQALAVARSIVAQINEQCPEGSADIDRVGMAAQLVSEEYYKGVHVEKGIYYRTEYGVFVKRESSCAGCTRALGLVLSCMGYKWSHVNENQWTHQWVSVTMDGQEGFADGQVGWVGYGTHPLG